MAGLDIEIMYADLDGAGDWLGTRSRRRVPIAAVNGLPKVGVLFQILSAETTEAMARAHIDGVPVRRVREAWGGDHYAYLRYAGEGEDAVLIWPWNDRSFAWARVADPFVAVPDPLRKPHWNDKINWPPWMPSEVITFEGFNLPDADWKEALADFSKSMH